MRVLLLSHQLDYSGAPLALLELAKVLREFGHSVFLGAINPGPLGNDFAAIQVRPLPSRQELFDLYVANTVLTVPAALAMAPSPASVLAWIHETEFFFRILGAGPEAFSVQKLTFAAFPARFQADEFAKWMPTTERLQLSNCVRMPAIARSAGPPGYYACAGRWEARKNQTRLLELVKALPAEPSIWFIGADRPPGITSKTHSFLGVLSPGESKRVIAESRGLVSPSLAEAQPLTAIEAMMAGRPVLLSDIPAHRELRETVPEVILFDPSRVESFVTGFRTLQEQESDLGVRNRLREAVQRTFGPEAFARNVRHVLGNLPLANDGGRRGTHDLT